MLNSLCHFKYLRLNIYPFINESLNLLSGQYLKNFTHTHARAR